MVIAYPTDRELLDLSYIEFFEQIIVKKLGAKAMVEGPNFFFGRDRQGDTSKLQELCDQHDLRLEVVEPIVQGERFISSSRIRELVSDGQISAAADMLTQPYRVRGMVTHGAGRGKQLGFPTANLDAVDTLVPGMGVYAGRAFLDGITRWAAIHIGPSETFADVYKIEVHILDFSGSLYGNIIEVEFIQQLREPQKFESAAELQNQVQLDVDNIRTIAKTCSTKAI